jgi:hypothetical protein
MDDCVLVGDDPRVLSIQKKFEALMRECPAELKPWRRVKLTRKGGALHLEISATFKIEVAT